MKYNPHLGDFETFYNNNKRLIYKICGRYLRQGKAVGLEDDDIFSIGHEGFIRAYEKYDPAFGTKFSTLCVPSIAGDVRRRIMEYSDGALKFGRTVRYAHYNITLGNLEDNTPQEVVDILGIPYKVAKEALEYDRMRHVVHVDGKKKEQREDNEDVTILDSISECADYSGVHVEEFISQLKPRHQTITRGRMAHMTQEQIGKLTGISQPHVKREMNKIEILLRQYLEGKPVGKVSRNA